VASLVDFRKAAFLRLSYIPLLAALSLSVLLVLFGSGPGSSRARVNLGLVQPVEAIRLLLGFFLAGYFAQRWELLRQVRAERIGRHHLPAWLQLPRPEYVLPIVGGVGAALLFFFVQRDLGPALFLACVFLAMYSVARARVGMALAGSVLLLGGFYLGYWLNVSDTLTARVRMWQSPWDNAVRGGDQVAQAIWAVATGGWFGAGLGFGDTRYLPAGHTDLVLAAVGEELGMIGLLAIVSVYALIAARGLWIARRAATDYGFFLALAVTLFLSLPVLMMASGVLGLTPLTGVVTPFVSYGGSAMVANMVALGVLVAISGQQSRGADMTPFARPTTGLGAALAGAAAVIIGVMVHVSVINADDLALRPHLSQQADGVRRYQYNPRVLDIARGIPRGTITIARVCHSPQASARSPDASARCTPDTTSLSTRAATHRSSAAIRSAARPFICWATRRPGSTGVHRTRRSSSAMRIRACAASTIARPACRTPMQTGGRTQRYEGTIAIYCRCSDTATSPAIRPCEHSLRARAISVSPSTRGCSRVSRPSSRGTPRSRRPDARRPS
jgi:cell division protein FtsW (lipid II flippase)